MSQVVSAFRSAVSTAVRTPTHALLVFCTTLLGAVVGGVLSLVPLVGPLVNGVVVAPALLVAVVGSAHAVRDGTGAFAGASAAVKRAGASVMGAYALLTAIYVGLSLVLAMVFGLLVFTAGMGGGMQSGSGLSALTGAVGVVVVLLSLVVLVGLLAAAMAVQFVAPAAVVADTDAVDSLKTSYRFFRRNLLGVTGLSLVLAGVGVVALTAVGLLFAVGRAFDPGAGLALAAVGYLVALAAVGSVASIYQVAYFDAVVDAAALPDGHEPESGESDTGAFVVGDVSRADAGDGSGGTADTATDQQRDPETGGFHVEMAGEDETAEEDSSADGTGWGTDAGDRDP